MLPFLKKKLVGGVLVKHRQPDEDLNEDTEYSIDDELELLSNKLLQSIETKDVKRMSENLKEIFMCLESYPHEENNIEESDES